MQLFEQFYREHVQYVWRTLRHLGLDDSDARDAMQEVFLVTYRRYGDWEQRCSARTWLFGVCYRVVLGRKRRVRSRKEVPLTERPEPLAEAPDSEEVVARREAGRELERILSTMTLEQRAAFVLFEIEGLRGDEIAQALGVPEGTVRSRLRSARSLFDRALNRARARQEPTFLARGARR